MNEVALEKFVHVLNDPLETVSGVLQNLSGKRGRFFLCIGSTHSSNVEGISAAGVSADARRLTPCIDAEALIAGRAISADSIPVSPAGVASPVVITRACLQLSQLEAEVFDCGAFVPAAVAATRCGGGPAACLSSGSALPLPEVEALFAAGLRAGTAAASQYDYLVLGECVPAGTTTAMGVLTALGWQVREMLSSSLTEVLHDLRYELVASGLRCSGLTVDQAREAPLRAVAAVGDPMQPFVAGVATAALEKIPVILAGGSQMLAVFALIQAIRRVRATRQAESGSAKLPLVATTKWVAYDRYARTVELSAMIGAPYVASCPDFSKSRHEGMRAYELGNVKEGAGAGASMLIAHAGAGCTEQQILEAVDRTYEELFERRNSNLRHDQIESR